MTHSAIHAALAMVTVTAAMAGRLARAVARESRPFRTLERWLLLSYAAALYALIPSLLEHAGVPARLCSGWWMNVFFFHPLLTRLRLGGTIIATAALASLFTLQYVVVLATLWRLGRDDPSKR